MYFGSRGARILPQQGGHLPRQQQIGRPAARCKEKNRSCPYAFGRSLSVKGRAFNRGFGCPGWKSFFRRNRFPLPLGKEVNKSGREVGRDERIGGEAGRRNRRQEASASESDELSSLTEALEEFSGAVWAAGEKKKDTELQGRGAKAGLPSRREDSLNH